MHETLLKFGFPSTALLQHGKWHVLLRPRQVTLGSLVLIHSSPEARSLGDISAEDFQAFPVLCNRIEQALRLQFGASRFNYLALMMVDPHVHFHVLPRYQQPAHFQGIAWPDASWPKPPDLTSQLSLTDDHFEALRLTLVRRFGETQATPITP